MDKRQQTDKLTWDNKQTDIWTRDNKQTYGHEAKKQTDMDIRQQTDRYMDSQTAKGQPQGVYFGMSDKPYFDPYIFGKLHLKIHNTVR